MAQGPVELIPGENPDLREEVRAHFSDPDLWLDTENDQFGGRKPRDLIGTEDEKYIRNLLRMIKYGMMS